MSGLKKIQCELQEKPWKDYSSIEIRRYCLRNMSEFDCSFVVEHEENKKEYESFKWILWGMSPVLKEILNDKENQEKDCKQIVVSNPNHIEAILVYGHFKVVDTKIVDLVDFYGASKQYQVKIMEDEVIQLFESEENQKKADWVRLFWLSYVKYPEDQRMRAVFEKVIKHVNGNDKVAEANIDLILEFEEEFFDIFFDIILVRVSRIKCFRISEAYLIKHFFDGNKNKKLEDIGVFQRNFVERCMCKIVFGGKFCWEDLKNGPLVSNLLSTKIKIETLKYKINNCNDKSLIDEVQLFLQKLLDNESNLKTEGGFTDTVRTVFYKLKKIFVGENVEVGFTETIRTDF